MSPVFSGQIYCALIEACQELSDFGRAEQWTTMLNRWCDTQDGLVAFTGQCAVHRGQIMRLHGAFTEALLVDRELDGCAPAPDGALGDLADGRPEPDLVERDGLEPGDDPAELLGCVTRDGERPDGDRPPPTQVARVERLDDGVEHLRERRDVLDRAVVQPLGDAAPLGPLGEEPLGDDVVVAQSIIASRSAMATAWVRVSASSFERI